MLAVKRNLGNYYFFNSKEGISVNSVVLFPDMLQLRLSRLSLVLFSLLALMKLL